MKYIRAYIFAVKRPVADQTRLQVGLGGEGDIDVTGGPEFVQFSNLGRTKRPAVHAHVVDGAIEMFGATCRIITLTDTKSIGICDKIFSRKCFCLFQSSINIDRPHYIASITKSPHKMMPLACRNGTRIYINYLIIPVMEEPLKCTSCATYIQTVIGRIANSFRNEPLVCGSPPISFKP